MQVSQEKRVHLVEYITHLSLEDWGAVTEDLVALEFLPAHMSEEQLAVISPVIKDVMSQLVIGGTAGISIGGLTVQVCGQQVDSRFMDNVLPLVSVFPVHTFEIVYFSFQKPHCCSWREWQGNTRWLFLHTLPLCCVHSR